MTTPTQLRALYLTAIGGMLFSGYAAGTHLLTKGCAFNEQCPYFFAVPACYIGFLLFTALALAAHGAVRGGTYAPRAYTLTRVCAAAGALFAGYYAFNDLPALITQGVGAYPLGLPTCVLGFLCFLLALLLATPSYPRRG